MPQNFIDCLEELDKNMDDKPDHFKDGIENHLGLWGKALEKSMALPSERLAALSR